MPVGLGRPVQTILRGSHADQSNANVVARGRLHEQGVPVNHADDMNVPTVEVATIVSPPSEQPRMA